MVLWILLEGIRPVFPLRRKTPVARKILKKDNADNVDRLLWAS